MVNGKQRPTGIAIIAVLWFLSGLFNVYMSFQVISTDVSVLPYLSNSAVDPWFSFGVPAEMILGFLSLFLGILQIVTVAGLWTGKRYSYRLALVVPLILLIGNICSLGLYASAPAELGLISGVVTSVVASVVSIVWLIIYWQYFDKPHVKIFLGVAETKPLP